MPLSNELIRYVDERFGHIVMFTETKKDDFDENALDFRNLSKLYDTVVKQELKPQFSVNSLGVELLMATFLGLSRNGDELIYFDKLKGDVLSHVEGYFSSHLGDQSLANRFLANKIANNEPVDYIDEDRYILIDRLGLPDFLEEYKRQTKSKEPFISFADFFAIEILKDFSYDDEITISDLAISGNIQDRFQELFAQKYQHRVYELRDDYASIFDNTCRTLATRWIRNHVQV